MSPHKLNVLPSPAALPSYGISENGFLPAISPLVQLPRAYYEPWEKIAQNLPEYLAAGQVRDLVDEMPVLDTSHLATEAEWQRAYSVLAILTQSYVWQGPEPSQRLPPAISIPFLEISAHLEVNPIATYAAMNLWNWKQSSDSVDLCQPDNMVCPLTQTGTDDESWFFIISNAMEARAGPIIRKMLEGMEAVEQDDADAVIDSLEYFHLRINEIGALLERMDERCHPQVFYHHIRPYLAGFKNMEAAGLPNGVFYDEGNGKGSWRPYRGGSNGQSSLLQFFDAALGVNHKRCGDFHAEMRSYMPGPHARFLNDIEAIANIRPYVESHPDNAELVAAYNEALARLSGFRDKHIAIVTRYIIIPSRTAAPGQNSGRKNLATATTKMASHASSAQELVGTGGTKLVPFLRISRDETGEAVIPV